MIKFCFVLFRYPSVVIVNQFPTLTPRWHEMRNSWFDFPFRHRNRLVMVLNCRRFTLSVWKMKIKEKQSNFAIPQNVSLVAIHATINCNELG